MKKIEKYKGVLLYLIFGVLTTLINVIVYWISYYSLSASNIVSTVIAWIIAVLFAFITNKYYVFDSKSLKKEIVLHELYYFLICRIGTGILDVMIMYFFVDLLNFPALLMKAAANVLVIILNYIASKLVIFKHKNG